MRKLLAIAMVATLPGCGFTGGLSTIGSQSSGISGTAASLFGIPAATVASQVTAEIVEIQAVAMQLQMLRAQLNGMPITPPPLSTPPGGAPNPVPTTTPPVVVMPPPVVVTVPPTQPPDGGPVVTPNARRRVAPSPMRMGSGGQPIQ